jgi:hypothetical protein
VIPTWREHWIANLPPEGEAALRRALLQRVADRLAFARAMDEALDLGPGVPVPYAWIASSSWSCCRVDFEYPTKPPYRYPMHRWAYRLCGDGCAHWHHQTEVLYA